jgi:hypothetical protein
MHFNSTEDIIVLPKVKLNSKAVFASLKTDAARGNIAGTCYSAYVTAGGKTKKTDMTIVSEANKGAYQVSATGTETETGTDVTISLVATSITNKSIVCSAVVTGDTAEYYEWSINGTVTAGSSSEKTFDALNADTTYNIKVRASYTDEATNVKHYTAWTEKVFTTPKGV